MKKDRQSKLVAILALCVSVVGLTLGFAAFSNTLTISSSATVAPNENDFDINIYGFNYDDTYTGDWSDFSWYSSEKSKTLSTAVLYNGEEIADEAKITDSGKSIAISDLSINMKSPNQGAEYYFLVKNEGEYDAYLNLDQFDALYFGEEGASKTCTPGADASADLVAGACESIHLYGWMVDEYQNDVYSSDALYDADTNTYKLEKDSYIYLQLYIQYGDVSYADRNEDVVRADGDFTVEFGTITLNFSTVAS